jgi:hypothetical protein
MEELRIVRYTLMILEYQADSEWLARNVGEAPNPDEFIPLEGVLNLFSKDEDTD